jgi:itaconate CoA-transferase
MMRRMEPVAPPPEQLPAPGAPMPGLPLDGLLVVAVEQAVAAPLATRQLADLGARVVKIERPGSGDFARGYDQTVLGLSSHFVWLNRGKQSLALDLKDAAAGRVLDRLLDRADVFVQNLAPGAAERLGLGADRLQARYPHLVTCSISGYGSSGPYRDAKAYDLLIQSEVGLVSITGTPEQPAKAGIPAADIAAGMYAFSGILAALYERERTGKGASLQVSLFDALAEWMGYPLYYAGYSGTAPARTGSSHAAIAPYGSFRAGDGSAVVLAIQNEREWADFCRHVLDDDAVGSDPRFSGNSQRVAHSAELHARIDATFAALTGDQLEQRLTAGRIAHARQRDLPEVLAHPQLAQRDRWTTVDSPAGPIRALKPPIGWVGREPAMGAVPAVGQHTEAILAELGLAELGLAELGLAELGLAEGASGQSG